MDGTAPNADSWLRDARVRVVERDGVTRVRLGGPSPIMTFLYTMAIAAMLEGIAYPIAAMIYAPAPVPVPLVAVAIGGAVLLGVLLALRRHTVIGTGREDLVIDDLAGTVSLPHGFGRDRETIVRVDRITEIAPADEVARTRDMLDADDFGPKRYIRNPASPNDVIRDTGHRSEMRYAVLVCWRDDDGVEIESPIVRWSGQTRVRALVFWLRERLGKSGPVPASPAP